jgi:hypothetical protein
MISLPLSHLIVKFVFDGKDYEVEYFNINFSQPSDFKGQPQHEIRGGQVSIHLSQVADDNLYIWAKTSTLRKSGSVLFQTDVGMNVLKIEFEGAYCNRLVREINASAGTNTIVHISPEKIKFNGIEHDNHWGK